ncbi:MAG: helix-turn-helix transcriptional regulator [Actinobacteria bacterium]|nr:helix-turn-helix transcriptional regulator [Actinomycetota bacterium]
MDDRKAAEIAKALGHPLRIALIRAIRDQGQLSPTRFSRETGEPLGNVSYHAKALEAAGILRVTETAQRRGALEHFYALSGPNAGIVLAVLDLLSTA